MTYRTLKTDPATGVRRTMATECIECGTTIPDDEEPVWGQGTSTGQLESAESGETVTADEAFEFDDGPYCGFDCLMAE